MLHPNRRVFFIGVVALAAGAVVAQQRPPAEQGAAVFRADTRLVVLHATVQDKNGRLLTALPREAFTVRENGIEQQIRQFKREDVPVSMGLVVDNSGSMRDKRTRVETACLALVKDSNPEDEVVVVNFNDEAFNDLPNGKSFTSDIKDMEEALTRIDSRGGTAMRDALRVSIDHVKQKGRRDKKVLVVVTDGNDNSSTITLESLVKTAQQSEIVIYTVGLLNEEDGRERKRAERALKALAEATGGAVYFPKDASDVERIAHQVARDIRNQYTIVYSPLNQEMDGAFRQIKVTAKGPGSPAVRTRSGYYATPSTEISSAGSAFRK
jgi:Ca-activated chloride channel family protein